MRWTVCTRGGVLILTLWMVVFLSSIVLMLGAQILTGGEVARAYGVRAQSFLALETFRARFEAALERDETKEYDLLSDPWSRDPDLFGEIRLGPAASARLGTGSFSGAVDEERFINVNTASPALLKQLFMAAGGLDEAEAGEMASAVQDWRDLDAFSSSPTRDTESGSKNGPLESVEELTLVPGMTPELFRAIRPLVTIYGTGKVNVNTVPKEVLKAMGAPESLAEKIVRYRAGPDGEEGTKDDGFFESAGIVEPRIEAANPDLATEELNALARMRSEDWVGVRSEFFRLPVQVSAYGKSRTRSVIVDRKGKRWEIR